MTDLPPIPNYVQWFALGLAIIVGVITLIQAVNWIWQRWLADRWATRSRLAAKRRAEKLLWRTADGFRLSRNPVAALAVAQRGLYRLINGNILVLFGAPLLFFGATLVWLVDQQQWLAYVLYALAGFIYALGVLYLVASWNDEDKAIAPLVDFQRFKATQAHKVRRLLIKAGLPEHEADVWFTQEFAKIDARERREITPLASEKATSPAPSGRS